MQPAWSHGPTWAASLQQTPRLFPRSPTDLSEMLKEGTKDSHDQAENTQFVKDFLKGRIKRELFKVRVLIRGRAGRGRGCTRVGREPSMQPSRSCACLQLGTVALYYTYAALEEEMERNKDQAAFAPLYFPQELHRTEALAKDLEHFYGEGWREKVQCSEATQRYVDRIHHVGQHEPELLVAHAYTRYMGDLSGGQVLKKVAQRALKLPSTGEGVQFYIFENISSPQQFKQLYRARMNALELDQRTKERVVEEANKAFEFNMQVLTVGVGEGRPPQPRAQHRPLCRRGRKGGLERAGLCQRSLGGLAVPFQSLGRGWSW